MLGGLHPVTQRLVGRIFERARAGLDHMHLGPKQLHAKDVEALAANVFGAHVDFALQAEVGGCGGGGHAVLAGTGLRDHPLLAHTDRQQRLAERIVDLVRSGVSEIFSLQVDLRPACIIGEALGEGQRRRPAGISAEQLVKLDLESLVFSRLRIRRRKLIQGRDQRLGHISTAEGPEPPGSIWERRELAHAPTSVSRVRHLRRRGITTQPHRPGYGGTTGPPIGNKTQRPDRRG